MYLSRLTIDHAYKLLRPLIFLSTKDPEKAHEYLVRSSKWLNSKGLDRFLLDSAINRENLSFELSNAAGFNKNGDIPPTFLRYLGFDRVVVGTVTGEPYKGNPRPRIKRYLSTESMVNWMGLPGIGAEEVAKNIDSYGVHGIPITINLMATPGKTGNAVFNDLEKTVRNTRDLPYVDRFELNVSCPNTHSSSGKVDARGEYAAMLSDLTSCVFENLRKGQELWEKMSPDLTRDMVNDTVEKTKDFVTGYTTTNTTTHHDPFYVTQRPNAEGKGGASGKAVYSRSSSVQGYFADAILQSGKSLWLIACGGIDSVDKMKERLSSQTEGVQIFTPLIFKGPGLLTKLRRSLVNS